MGAPLAAGTDVLVGVLYFLAAEGLAVFSTWCIAAMEIHSRARILDLAGQEGRRDWAQEHLHRLPTYDLTTRLTRFLGNALVVIGATHLLARGRPADAFPWGPLAGALGIAFAVFLINDVAVRLLARRRPNRFLIRAFPYLSALRRATTPLRIPTKLLAWLFFRVSLESAGPGAREEVRLAVDEGRRSGAFTKAEADMLAAVVDLDRTTAGDVLTSRGEMVMLKAEAAVWEAAAVAHLTGHSRFPVYGKDKDDVVGVVTVRDLLAHYGRAGGDAPRVRDVMRAPYFVPEGKRVRDLLEDMRARRIHMAVVNDEFGQTAGLVTIEDLLEQVVGEIDDEYDLPPEAFHATAKAGMEAGVLVVDGRTPIATVNRALKVGLPIDEHFETVGGLVLHRLGKVPKAGDRLELDDVALVVTEADERTVKRVEITLSAGEPRPESA